MPQLYDYRARGVPNGPDEGTLELRGRSLQFRPPGIVLSRDPLFRGDFSEMTSKYGFKGSFNPTGFSWSEAESRASRNLVSGAHTWIS